jgi:hypothetical protein
MEGCAVAGSLVSILLGGAEGALAGAAAGGIFSGLAAWGISKQHILKYEQSVRAGFSDARAAPPDRQARTAPGAAAASAGARRSIS